MPQPSIFNAEWYLEKNPDVAAAVRLGLVDARQHFEHYGHLEGRDPGPLFDTQYYLASNPDVAGAVKAGQISAYDHFVHYGAAENRSPSELFSPDLYLAQNPDIAAVVNTGALTAVQHYVAYGHKEGRPIGITPDPDPTPDPAPDPTPDPTPDPDPEQNGVLLSLAPKDWTPSGNQISFTLEFDSSIQLNGISLKGNGSLSLSRESISTGGRTVVETSLNATNGSQAGTIDIEFIVPPGSEGKSVSIKNFTINGNVYPDIAHPLDGSPGTIFEYHNLSIENSLTSPKNQNNDWDDIFWGWDNIPGLTGNSADGGEFSMLNDSWSDEFNVAGNPEEGWDFDQTASPALGLIADPTDSFTEFAF